MVSIVLPPAIEIRIPLNEHARLTETYDVWKRQDPLLIRDLSGEALEDFKKYINPRPSCRQD